MCVHMSASFQVIVCVFAQVCVHVCSRRCVHVFVCAGVCAGVCVHAGVCAGVCPQVCVCRPEVGDHCHHSSRVSVMQSLPMWLVSLASLDWGLLIPVI